MRGSLQPRQGSLQPQLRRELREGWRLQLGQGWQEALLWAGEPLWVKSALQLKQLRVQLEQVQLRARV